MTGLIVAALVALLTQPAPWAIGVLGSPRYVRGDLVFAAQTYGASPSNSAATNTAAILAAAADAAAAGGGIVQLKPGNFQVNGTLALPTQVALVGSGRGATTITGAAGMTATMVSVGFYGALKDVTVSAPTTLANDIVVVPNGDGVTLRGLQIEYGGANAIWAINATDFLRLRYDAIIVHTTGHGIRFAEVAGALNIGNSEAGTIEVDLLAVGRTGIDIEGYQGGSNKKVNLMTFGQMSVTAGAAGAFGAGATGLNIVNSSHLLFNGVSLEGCATSLHMSGQIGVSGDFTRGIVFNNIYCDNAVQIDAAVRQTTFVGGKIIGAITEVETSHLFKARYYGTIDGSGALIIGNAQHRGHLTGTLAWDPAGIADGATQSQAVTVTGAAVGDPAFASLSSITAAGWIISAVVTSASTVTVTIMNKTGALVDLPAGTLRCEVIKYA